jgi:argininosuccinate lyase
LTSIHNTPFGDINDVEDDLQPLIYNAMRDANRSVALFAGTLQSAKFNLETLRRRASENFITVTELADTIVRRENLPFRISHKIVGICVKTALENGTEITHEILQNAAREILGREIKMTEAELKETLSPENFVRIRTIYGGCAPEETRRALMVERENETVDEEWIVEKLDFLENAARRLRKIVDKKLEKTVADKFSAV